MLPDSERLVDATVEQFDEIRAIGAGPLIGRVALSTRDDGSMMQPGAQVMLQRGDLVLTYTVAGPEALASIVEHPEMAAHADDHHRTGVNVASFALAALRGEGVRGRAMQAPHPRLRALRGGRRRPVRGRRERRREVPPGRSNRPGAVAAAGRDPAAVFRPRRLAPPVNGSHATRCPTASCGMPSSFRRPRK
ncbi:hypothetical protein [Streptomyces hygroscopicus]|uniref:hypothetical protein n=1 Tax=Streptomyces hygroscopicus TaxID=1912 RepID=UPI000AE20A44|nr:hypothetical protein [Streptomyces hygroscopicus]